MLFKKVTEFLDHRYRPERRVLLAFSGGPDSLALLHLLLEYRRTKPFHFDMAHVDHKWRPESTQEAEIIQAMAKKMDVPLHVKALDPSLLKGNLEAASRDERLSFFESLCETHHFQAVLLGHHADDQAETVLKRAFEGASLSSLCGLQAQTKYSKMDLWRPLLTVPKKEILDWLEARGLSGFHDSTNEDNRFLRARFRSIIIPGLEKEFGKRIGSPLCSIGAEAAELREYLDFQVAPYLSLLQQESEGISLDLREKRPQSAYETKHLIRKFCAEDDVTLSRPALEKAAQFLLGGEANKEISAGSKSLYIDRYRLLLRMKIGVEGE